MTNKQKINLDEQETETPQPLKFYSDKGADRAKWIAGALVFVLIFWMGSGFIFPSKKTDDDKAAAEKIKLISVAVKELTAEPVTLSFVAEGQSLPDRETAIRVEEAGKIIDLNVKKGELVKKGQVLAKFNAPQKAAELERAEEEVSRTKIDYENAKKLLKSGVSTTQRVNAAQTAYASAKAQLENAKQGLSNIIITAPFDGRLEKLSINEGEYVQKGTQIGLVVDNDPLTIKIQVPQQTVKQLKTGQEAKVDFITGESVNGVVSFIGSSADASTRTFTAEILVQNPDRKIRAGISANVSIPTKEVKGQFISPAILSLSSDGTLGVKTVNAENKVVFNKVEIIRAQTDGLWVLGLGDKANIISVGQGFVKDGEQVVPIPESKMEAESAKQVEPATQTKEKAE